MKRIISMLLVLIIAMSTMGALAAPGDATLGRDSDGLFNTYYSGVFAIEDTLYLFNDDSISTWRVGDREPVNYALQLPAAGDANDTTWFCRPFAANGSLYALALETRYGENTEFLRALLCGVSLTREDDQNIAKLTEHIALNWEDMIDHYGEDSSAREPQSCVGMGELCCMLIPDSEYKLQLKLMNVSTGEIKTAASIPDACAFTPYKDNKLLVEQFTYDAADRVRFSVYDPESDRAEEIASFKVEGSAPLNGLVYDAENDALYCIWRGEIHNLDLQKGEIGAAIADAPVEYANDSSASILQGGYYCYGSTGAFVRNLDPAQRTETRIRVFDNSYSDAVQSAKYALTRARDDISVAVVLDYSVGEHVAECLLNHDDSVDVYTMSSSDEAFGTAFKRNDWVSLDDSEKLAALAQCMYPGVRGALSQNGHLVAIPISCYASTLAVNQRALDRLGIRLEDVPRNWVDMLDFISALTDRIKPEDKVNLFYEGETFESVKTNLFNQIIQDYQNYANHADPAVGYNTELMRGLIAKLESIDFSKLGCKHEDVDDNGTTVEGDGELSDGEEALSLFETYSGCAFGSFSNGDYVPILMSPDVETPVSLFVNMNIAFINPYSKHPEEARLFMGKLSEALSNETMYSINPSLISPVRSRYYKDSIQAMNEELDALKAQYANANDADKPRLEADIAAREREIVEYEQTSWDISQANIDWYRSNDDSIVLQGANWLSAGEANGLIEQYLAGQIDADALLVGLDNSKGAMSSESN